MHQWKPEGFMPCVLTHVKNAAQQLCHSNDLPALQQPATLALLDVLLSINDSLHHAYLEDT